MAAGDEAPSYVCEDLYGLQPGKVMQGQARDDGAEVGVRERQAVGKIYAFRFGFRRPPTGELKRLLREVRGDDFEAPSRETLGILSGAAAEVEDGRVDVRLKEVSPAFQPGVLSSLEKIRSHSSLASTDTSRYLPRLVPPAGPVAIRFPPLPGAPSRPSSGRTRRPRARRPRCATAIPGGTSAHTSAPPSPSRVVMPR